MAWVLLLGSLFLACWFVFRGPGIPVAASYAVELASLEVSGVASPRSGALCSPGSGARGRSGCGEGGALRAESSVAMERLGGACGADESVKEGFLEKLSSKGRWQQRYFVLSESHLAYLGSRGDRKKAPRRVKFAIALAEISGVAESGEGEVTVTYGAGERFTVRAVDGRVAGLWVEALRSAAPEGGARAPGSPGGGGGAEASFDVDPLPRKERDAVEALRARVGGEATLQVHDWLLDDATLVRFLRARDHDVFKATSSARHSTVIRRHFDEW